MAKYSNPSAKEVAQYFLESAAEFRIKLPRNRAKLRPIVAEMYEGWVSLSEWKNPSLEAVLTAILKA